jgi:hypothetical protein
MKPNLLTISWLLLSFSVLSLVALTVFEPTLPGMSAQAERLLSFGLLVLPAAVGIVLGVLSLVRREPRPALALTGVVLNSAFALFHLAILLFAG